MVWSADTVGQSDSGPADDDLGQMVASFVTDLKAQLPMEVGPGINMVNVDYKDNVVALGFTIAQTVSEVDTPKLQNELEMRFRTSVYSTPPDPCLWPTTSLRPNRAVPNPNRRR